MSRYGRYGDYPPYVSVAERKRQAQKKIEKLKKQGAVIEPIVIEGRTITKTFWGKAWCANLESYSDYENRLPRGRTYVRNGSVVNLNIESGKIHALVQGSSMYKVSIGITEVLAEKWNALLHTCTGKIDSLIELLQGRFSTAVMEVIANPTTGLFPHPKEISLHCSCPDWADMCKHVAAVLYGVGARLDEKPEYLFLLRQVDHLALIANAGGTTLSKTATHAENAILAEEDLSSLFGIDMEVPQKIEQVQTKPTQKAAVKKQTVKKVPAKKTLLKKQAVKKTPAKKTLLKKQAVKKTPAKKTLLKKQTVKKAPVKKTLLKKQTVKKAPVKKTLLKKQAVKKTPAKKTLLKKQAVKKTATKKLPSKRKIHA
jgi:uncharacterized Zn finger protein